MPGNESAKKTGSQGVHAFDRAATQRFTWWCGLRGKTVTREVREREHDCVSLKFGKAGLHYEVPPINPTMPRRYHLVVAVGRASQRDVISLYRPCRLRRGQRVTSTHLHKVRPHFVKLHPHRDEPAHGPKSASALNPRRAALSNRGSWPHSTLLLTATDSPPRAKDTGPFSGSLCPGQPGGRRTVRTRWSGCQQPEGWMHDGRRRDGGAVAMRAAPLAKVLALS